MIFNINFLFPVFITSNAKFVSNIDLRKVDFLSQEKISDRSCVLTNVIIQSGSDT